MSLASFLRQAGYRRVSLERTGVGHFEASGTLAGHPVRVLIDTGASSTVVDLATAQTCALDTAPLGATGGGAGGSNLTIYQIPGTALRLGDAVVHPKTLYAMDLTHCNAALAQKGALPVQMILGVDVYEAYHAVIDYSSSSLFLRDSEVTGAG